jgi:hypothetical protein
MEKIIQIVYQKDEYNPTLLTSNGRVIRCLPTNAFIENTDRYGIKTTLPVYEYKDVTPKLDKI